MLAIALHLLSEALPLCGELQPRFPVVVMLRFPGLQSALFRLLAVMIDPVLKHAA